MGIGVAICLTYRLITYRANMVTGARCLTSCGSVHNPPTKGMGSFSRHRGTSTVLARMPMVGAIGRPSGGVVVCSGVHRGSLADRLIAGCTNMVTGARCLTIRRGVYNPLAKSMRGFSRHRGASTVLANIPMVRVITRPRDCIIMCVGGHWDGIALRVATLTANVVTGTGRHASCRFVYNPSTIGMSWCKDSLNGTGILLSTRAGPLL